ncbi:MAG: hypothetical protein ACREIH_04915 [Nitrospiraceae bacterium]
MIMQMVRKWNPGFFILLVALTMVLPATAEALTPTFVLPGSAGICVAESTNGLPATPTTNGCRVLIAGTYIDGAGNSFQILDASATNQARIEFEEGSVDKLILSGAVIKATAVNTNATITFKHFFSQSASAKSDAAESRSRNSLSGGFSLLTPNLTARTVTATAAVELCPSEVCATPSGNPLSPPVVGSIPVNSSFKTYVPTPDDDVYCTVPCGGGTSQPLASGQIVISSLRTNERVTNLTNTVLVASSSNMPPFDSPGACDNDSDIGKIIRQGTALNPQDRICIKSDTGSFLLVTGQEALSIAEAGCPLPIDQEIDGLKHEAQIQKMIERDQTRKQ